MANKSNKKQAIIKASKLQKFIQRFGFSEDDINTMVNGSNNDVLALEGELLYSIEAGIKGVLNEMNTDGIVDYLHDDKSTVIHRNPEALEVE